MQLSPLAHVALSFLIITVIRNSTAVAPSGLKPRVDISTIPNSGRDLDDLTLSTFDSEYTVSPGKIGLGTLMSVSPNMIPFLLVWSTLSPTTTANVNIASTSSLPWKGARETFSQRNLC